LPRTRVRYGASLVNTVGNEIIQRGNNEPPRMASARKISCPTAVCRRPRFDGADRCNAWL